MDDVPLLALIAYGTAGVVWFGAWYLDRRDNRRKDR